MAIIGETIGARLSSRSGWYLRTYETTAGQLVATWRPVAVVDEQAGVVAGDEVGAEGDLVDGVEAEVAQGRRRASPCRTR